ncbi:copper chaperone PCu(A)C [Aestuariirhabdus sp. LZHN29]|uniref:copper chaperone PCu(A)C n=1 Tax=Aestuariirhabdus sp. LZHN29 TaxID=3417462 RepID=UPI003CF2AC29
MRLLSTFFLLLSSLSFQVSAASDLVVSEGWVRATPPGAPNSAAYMKISNLSSTPMVLVAARTLIANRVELHQSKMEMGMMKMEHQDQGLAIAPKSTLELKPGGYHVMLMGIKEPLKQGEQVMLILEFGNGELRELLLPVATGAPGEIRPVIPTQ